MLKKSYHESINNTLLDGQVWSIAVDEEEKVLFIDTRQEQDEVIELNRLSLEDFQFESRIIDLPWWIKLQSAMSGDLYFTEYQDQNDPSQKRHFKYNWNTNFKEDDVSLNLIENLVHPHVYEHGTEYHKMVSQFLSIDLPLSCEYLEWENKIIISYYIRSDKEFIRYLLLLEDGEKVWKISQDTHMKGFSPGSFFVFNDQIIFIKDRNEVCIYTS